jgi:hypothetical protein
LIKFNYTVAFNAWLLGPNRITAWLVIISILVLTLAVHGTALAQFVPLPPPSASTGQQNKNSHVAINDKSPPKIEILTKTIYEGKNVFKVKIMDESGIGSSNIKYVNNGQIVTKPLSPLQGRPDIYQTLVDMRLPSRIVQLQVTDMAGNTVDTYETYDIVSSNDILKRLTDSLTKLWNSLTMGK